MKDLIKLGKELSKASKVSDSTKFKAAAALDTLWEQRDVSCEQEFKRVVWEERLPETWPHSPDDMCKMRRVWEEYGAHPFRTTVPFNTLMLLVRCYDQRVHREFESCWAAGHPPSQEQLRYAITQAHRGRWTGSFTHIGSKSKLLAEIETLKQQLEWEIEGRLAAERLLDELREKLGL